MSSIAGFFTYSGADIDNMTRLIRSIGLSVFTKSGDLTLFYVIGESDISSSQDFIDFVSGGVDILIKSYDISISTEDQIDFLVNNDTEADDLSSAHIHGKSFDQVKTIARDLIVDTHKVVVVREAEYSDFFGEKVIKVDFLS